MNSIESIKICLLWNLLSSWDNILDRALLSFYPGKILSHEVHEALLWVNTLISISSCSCWCNRELVSFLCLPTSFGWPGTGRSVWWLADSSVKQGLSEGAGDTILQENCHCIFFVLGAPLMPPPPTIYVNKGLVRNGFGQSRAGTCASCEVF